MAKTRAKGGASTTAAPKTTSQAPAASRFSLEPESPNPPKIFILPKKATSEARVVSLLNPRYLKPTRYLVCPDSGIYEFTRIAAPNSTPRSWLIECPNSGELSTGEDGEGEKADREGKSNGFSAYVTKGAELYIATPIDPVFLVIPALMGQSGSKSEKRLFLSSDDHFDSILKELAPHLSEVVRWDKVRKSLESRMGAVCDTVDAGDESMFRFSEDKLLGEMLAKARNMSKQPLPQSMEERFVTKALDAPVQSIKREVTTMSATSAEPATSDSGASTPQVESSESQSSVSSTETTASTVSIASTAVTVVEEEVMTSELTASIVASPEITQLQRLRIAFSFLCSSYIAPAQAAQLKKLLSENKDLVDFTALDEYLAQVTKLRHDAVSSRSATDYSRKRVLDDEEVMERAEKKRKKEEDEKRKKAAESRGVKNLKKVNIEGMKKMSDFFKKK